jgi:polyhydroxybutyrate depolymerase
VPIALLLHGWQSDGLGFQKWFRFEEQTRDAAYVVYPDAVRGLWDVVGSKDLDYLEHVLDQVARAYCVDRSRVLVFGFSYGAKMANHLGCKRPDLAQAVMAGAGSWVDRTPDCGAPLPVLVVNRTSDSSELAAWGHDAARRWAGVQACDRAETASPLGEGCTEFADCRAPGSVTWCEDAWLDPKWPQDWNHTVRENYRAMAWRWFQALPETR